MIFYPKGYFNKVSEISLKYLKENNIKGLILDVDNTLIDYYKNISEDTINWANELKQNGIKMCILSNSNKKEKVKEVAQKLELEYSYFGMKPLKRGFKKAKQKLDLENSEIAVEAARQQIAFAQGTEDLQSALEDNLDILRKWNEDAFETYEAAAEVQDALEKMFDVKVSANFIHENLEEIEIEYYI